MASSKEELLSLCVSYRPEAVVELDGGVTVKVKALKGSDSARVSSMQNMDEQILFALTRGVLSPKLDIGDIQKLLDESSKSALKIFTRIMELSNALGEAEKEEAGNAEKN